MYDKVQKETKVQKTARSTIESCLTVCIHVFGLSTSWHMLLMADTFRQLPIKGYRCRR